MNTPQHYPSTFPTLSTQRLLLRAMEPRDQEGYAELLTEPKTFAWITDHGPVARRDVLPKIQRNRAAFAQQHLYWTLEHSQQFLGYIALHNASSQTASLSYAIRSFWRRKGFASEAHGCVISYAQTTLPCQQLHARTHVPNCASQQLLLSLGFSRGETLQTALGPRETFTLSTM